MTKITKVRTCALRIPLEVPTAFSQRSVTERREKEVGTSSGMLTAAARTAVIFVMGSSNSQAAAMPR